MAQKVDLFTLLKTYSFKNYAAEIDLETFITFMEKNAGRDNAAELNIDDWRIDTRGKVLRNLNDLASSGKVGLTGPPGAQKVFVHGFFADIIAKYYQAPPVNAGASPFPQDSVLRLKIPQDKLKLVSVEAGLVNFLNEKQSDPNQIVRLVFQQNYGHAIALAWMFPQKILEFALQKIEHAFHSHGEMEYYAQKLMIRFKAQETRVRAIVNMIITRPMEIMKSIEESNEFTYSLWLFLCPLIQKRIEEMAMRSNDLTTAQIALFQAAGIVLAVNSYYQVIVSTKRNIEMALGMVFEQLTEPPYIYNVADMLQFKNNAGLPLNQRFSQNDLDNFLREKITLSSDGKVQELLKFRARDGTEWYVRKEKVWNLCTRLVSEALPQVKAEIVQRWMKILREYKREPAMEKDEDFEELLERFCDFFSPQLLMIIRDKKIALLQSEILSDEGTLPKNTKFFEVDKPVPMRMIFSIRREDIIYNCKLSLPFWYSIGFLVKIISLFKKPEKGAVGKNKKKPEKDDDKNSGDSFRACGERLAKTLVPDGSDIDEYLEMICDRWNQLLDRTAQKRLTEDINAIIKAHLNQVLKIQKPNTLNGQILDENAERIIKMNASFDKISNKSALKQYIKVFIAKQLICLKK